MKGMKQPTAVKPRSPGTRRYVTLFAGKHKSAILAVAGALALGVPAASSAAITLPGFGTSQSSSLTPVSSIVSSNTGVLGADGPLGANGPLGGGGCISANVNPNSLGMDGPLGPNGPLGPGGFAANLSC
ncbi:MAG: hypothetical protein QOE28_1709, partial [Solirubrobacteraceae bacterium]|nr:hypothetical protein [Solirubrobacteraceae bacterium]